jgi:hypothetical protein
MIRDQGREPIVPVLAMSTPAPTSPMDDGALIAPGTAESSHPVYRKERIFQYF